VLPSVAIGLRRLVAFGPAVTDYTSSNGQIELPKSNDRSIWKMMIETDTGKFSTKGRLVFD
ncbi:unnamed protein product, partial [Acidithrix sp. C25]